MHTYICQDCTDIGGPCVLPNCTVAPTRCIMSLSAPVTWTVDDERAVRVREDLVYVEGCLTRKGVGQ